ncbi:MAG: hypothetical protein SF187_10765 [Deltaproteobacteria bacterium]|nr:hypothetical protein [Deltaproteobacteria bacterium]
MAKKNPPATSSAAAPPEALPNLADWEQAIDTWDASIGGLEDLAEPTAGDPVAVKRNETAAPLGVDAPSLGNVPDVATNASHSDVVLIPDVAALSAAQAAPAAPPPVLVDNHEVSTKDVDAEPSVTQTSADLTEPLVHLTVSPEEVLLAEDVVLEDDFDPFNTPVAPDEDIALQPPPFVETRRLDGFVGDVDWPSVAAPATGPTTAYKEERLALLADELEARQAEGAAPQAMAWVAVEAARAAHMAQSSELMARLIERACTLDPHAVAPRRERLRLHVSSPSPETAYAAELLPLVTDVSERAGAERQAYADICGTLRALAGHRGVQRNDDLDPGLALRAARAYLASDDVVRASDAIASAGRALGGRVGAQLLFVGARLLETRSTGDRGVALREQARALGPAAPGNLMATLRLAGAFSASDTLAALQRCLAELTDDKLKSALGRWAASLAESLGNTALAAELLVAVVDGKPLVQLRVSERISLLPLHITDVIDNPEGWAEGLEPQDCALLMAAAAETALRIARPHDAVALLRFGLEAAPRAVFPAMLAERLCHSVSDDSVKMQALALWAEGDPARTGFALLQRCAELAHSPDSDLRHNELLKEQTVACEALPTDAAFLPFAWHELTQRRFAEAASLLEHGAARFEAMGELELATLLRERAEDANVAQLPTRAVVRAMARSSTMEETLDHPRVLALAPLEHAGEPAAVASVYRAAAMASRTVGLRVIEASVWMKTAGQRREAIQFLQPRWGQDKPSPTLSLLLRVLTNTFDDPESAASVFERLAAFADTNDHRSFWLFRRAEALAGAGRFAPAATALGEVGPGPLQAEALVAYRRTLWSARAFAALDALLRDEADGYLGVGQTDKASHVLVERAFVRAEGLHDLEGALALFQEALALEPSAVSVPALVMAAMQNNVLMVQQCLSALAASGDGDAALLRLLFAEARNDWAAASSCLLQARDLDPQRLTLIARQFGPGLSSEGWLGLVQALSSRVDGDPRSVQALRVRAAEALAREGDLAAAQTQLTTVVQTEPTNFAALRLQTRVAKAAGDTAHGLSSLIAAAQASSVPSHQAQFYLEAVHLAGKSDVRIEAWLRQALASEPANETAFSELRALLADREDIVGQAELIRVRQQSPLRLEEAKTLHLERASLLVRSGDKAAAKTELRALLSRDPNDAVALRELVELEYQDGAYSIAAEIYLRLARFENAPENQIEIFRRLGRIYHRRLSDPKLAAGAFERVVKLAPNDLDALSGLSDIYTKQNDLPRAIAATERAVAVEPDEKRRLSLLLRLASLHEKNGNARVAGNLLRRAHDQAPRSLQAIGELARYLERHKDTQGRRVLLDTSLGRLHEDLRRFPGDLSALRAIVPVLRWCSRAAGSAASAQLLAALSDDPVERRELQAWSAPDAKGRRLTPLVNPEVDEMSYPSLLPPGIRQVMRVLGPSLSKASRPDLRSYGVTRAERIGVAEGPRAIVDALAVDLGVRGFEVFVTTDVPHALLVEPGDPPAIVLGSELVKRGPTAVRFAAGYTLRLVATHFDLLASSNPGPKVLLTALVRQFLNVPPDDSVDEAAVQRALPRLLKALGRSQRAELRPFVAEIASPDSLAHVGNSVLETAARVGLLACGDLATSIQVLLAAAGQPLSPTNLAASPVAAGLFEFALSADYELLVRAIESVS